jgi:AcrR family transcriptional regulator
MARPREVSDEQILEAARDCFLEHGASAPTSRIASALGVSAAALFHRFGSKRTLMVRALMPNPGAVPDQGLLDERPVQDQLVEMGLQMLNLLEGMQPRLAVLKSAGIDHIELLKHFDVPPPVRMHRALTAVLAQAHEQGRAVVPDPAAVAVAFMGAVNVRVFLGGHLDVRLLDDDSETYMRRVVGALWAGMAPPVGDSP